ncbi:MAG: hypothetical protein AAGA91_20795 [Pseudomonadota bacterium]
MRPGALFLCLTLLLLLSSLLAQRGHASKHAIAFTNSHTYGPLGQPARSDDPRDESDERRRRDNYSTQGSNKELAQAAARAERRYGGKALAVRKVGERYRVRLLLPDGRVKTVDISE